MRYQNSSAIAYFFRNIWHYIYIVLPVSIFMAIFANFSNETAFLHAWFDGQLNEANYIESVMHGMALVSQPNAWWYGVISYLLLAVAFSLLVVKVSRHMRVGGFSVYPLKPAFKVIPSMLVFCACFAVALQLLQFIVFGIMYALSKAFVMDVVIVVGLVLLWLAIVVVAYFWMLMLLCFPLSYSESYPFNIALSYSIREMSKHQGLCILHAVSFSLVHVLVVVLDYFLLPITSGIVHALFYTFIIYYVPCLAFTIHHKTLGSERKDISRVLIG